MEFSSGKGLSKASKDPKKELIKLQVNNNFCDPGAILIILNDSNIPSLQFQFFFLELKYID